MVRGKNGSSFSVKTGSVGADFGCLKSMGFPVGGAALRFERFPAGRGRPRQQNIPSKHTHPPTHSLLHIPVRSCMKGEVIFSYGQYFCLFTGSHAALGKQHRIVQRFLFFFTPSIPVSSTQSLLLHFPLLHILSSPSPHAFLVCNVFPRHKEVRHHCGGGHPPVLQGAARFTATPP